MAFRSIENISINGSNKAFNGFVYNVDYEISLSSGPSVLTMHFVSEDGTYTEPALSVKTPYKVDIGNIISQNFFAVKWTYSASPEGKTLVVTFQDGSVILDNIWVGLHKRHGFNPKAVSNKNLVNLPSFVPNPYPDPIVDTIGQTKNMIIVGNESHPCDINEDGVFDEKDLPLLLYRDDDPCDIRCASDQIDINALQAECVSKTKTELLNVTYKFSELLKELPTYVKINKTVVLSNDFYKADYSGTLRETLQHWCQTLGLNFYWENDGLNFVDVSKLVKIKPPIFDCIESYSRTKTIEGTVARGAIFNYSQEGKVIDKTCQDAQRVSLQCLTLRDLFTDVWKPTYGAGGTGQPDDPADGQPPAPGSPETEEYKDDVYPAGVAVEKLEEACVCSYYDERLRQLYILRNYYGLNEIEDFVARKNQALDRFGSLKIFRVYDKYDTDEAGDNRYSDLIGTSTLFNAEDKELEKFEDNEGFFIIAKFDSKKLQDQFQQEERLAMGFIGQHWMKGYHAPYYGEEPEIKPGGQYIGANASELKNAAFANFNHSNDSKVGKLGQELQKRMPILPQLSVLDATRTVRKDTKTVIYYQRPEAVWNPSRETTNYFTSILNGMANMTPRVFTNASRDMLRDILADEVEQGKLTEDDFNDGRIVLMAMFRGYFEVTHTIGNNAFEENPIYMPVAQIPNAKLGLSSKRSVRYNVWGVTVEMPAGSSCVFNKDFNNPLMDIRHSSYSPGFNLYTPVNSSAPHYTVAVTQSRNPHMEIPKIEATFVSPPPSFDAIRTDYQIQSQIDNLSMRALNNLQTKCIPDVAVLQAAHQKFVKNLAFSQIEPAESYEFTVAGIGLDGHSASIADGLEAITIQLNDSGVISTFRFGNTLFTPIPPDVQARQIQFNMNRQLSQKSPFGNAVPPRRQ